MGRFVIHTHGRLQEWVAEEHDYYAQEGLTDYVLRPNDLGFDRYAPARTERGLQYGAYESYEKVDTTFMMAGMVANDADVDDVRRYYRALRRAQADVDVAHQKYTHYYLKELPERFQPLVDVRAFGPGERIVFEPYSRTVYESTHEWVQQRALFDPGVIGPAGYENAVLLS